MQNSKGKHRVPIFLLLLVLTLICSLSAVAQDKLLSNSTTNSNVANPPAVDCWAYAQDGTTCIAGQYFRSDGLVPSSTWTPTATATAFGAWAKPGTAPVSSCVTCHHTSLNSATNGMSYIVGGHKNILRKVVPGQPLLTSEGLPASTVVDHNGGLWTMDWATGTAGGNRAYYLAGWIPEPDLFGDFGQTTSGIPYGSCGRCHTTGYRYDDNGPEPTLYDPNTTTYTKLTTAQFPRVPAGGKTATGDPTGVNGPAGSWYLTGIQCERCHKADMQYDASVVTTQYNAGGTGLETPTPVPPNPTSTAGRVNHMTNIYVDPNNVGDCTWSASRSRSNCTLLSPVTVGDFTVPSVSAVGGTQSNLRGTNTFTGRPVPEPPYALLCVECHQAYSTWTAKTVGTVGETHTTPMPGFESLVPAMDTNKFTTTKAATGQFSATFKCSVSSITTATPNYYNACITAGGTVTYAPGGMSHGAVATILNSPHARVTGYVDAKSPATADSTLIIRGGTLGDGTVVNGQFNTHFESELGVKGSCMGCHNIHGYLEGYVETNAVNLGETLKKCTDCHTSHGQTMAHPTGVGTPYPDDQYGSQESCNICHFSKQSGTEYHWLRINPDPNYSTFPSASTYYTTYGSGKFAPLNTYNSGETYTDANNNTKPYPAVALDVDIACGQCHTGGNGAKNPYGIAQTIANAPAMTRAALAAASTNIHNVQAATPTFMPTYPYAGPATALTISSTTAGANIFYTTDGATPTKSLTACASPCTIQVNTSETVYAIAAVGWDPPSVVSGGRYSIQAVPKPGISPYSGNYTFGQTASVTMSDTFSGVTIKYTDDGTDPTTSGTAQVYGGAISVTTPKTLKAYATKAGYADSGVTTGTFNFKLSTPAFSNDGANYPGAWAGSAVVRLTDTNTAAVICYRTDNVAPTGSNGVCGAGSSTLAFNAGTGKWPTFTLSGVGYKYVKALATATGYTNSVVANGTYYIK